MGSTKEQLKLVKLAEKLLDPALQLDINDVTRAFSSVNMKHNQSYYAYMLPLLYHHLSLSLFLARSLILSLSHRSEHEFKKKEKKCEKRAPSILPSARPFIPLKPMEKKINPGNNTRLQISDNFSSVNNNIAASFLAENWVFLVKNYAIFSNRFVSYGIDELSPTDATAPSSSSLTPPAARLRRLLAQEEVEQCKGGWTRVGNTGNGAV